MTNGALQQQPAQQNGVIKSTLSNSERFTNAIQKEFASNGGEVELTPFQKKLCQNFFIKLDATLKELEVKRLKKAEKWRDPLSFTWDNINLPKLAIDVIIYSSVGLDATQPNHINTIPFKNNASNKFDIAFIMGYKGIELKAKKYGFDIPDDIIVELVYSNDKFKQIKKDYNNKVESYTFEIVDDFNRGEIIGGFYYHKYFNQPEKNKLRVFSKKDIDKRKPDHASADFWGGEKDVWEDGKKTGKVEVEGWYDEMAYKTVYRAAYNSITIDSEKIDANYLAVIQRERDNRDLKITTEIADHANKEEIGFDNVSPDGIQNAEMNKEAANDNVNVDIQTGEVSPKIETPPTEVIKEKASQTAQTSTQIKAPF